MNTNTTVKKVQALQTNGGGKRNLGQRARRQRTLVWVCCLWLAGMGASRGALVMDFFDAPPTISPSSPSLELSLYNDATSGSIAIGGVNFFITIGGGTVGPTMSTIAGEGVDLLTGTLFSGGTLGGQYPIGTPTLREQGWGVLASPAVSLDAGETVKLATLTFDSFPVGSYALDFSGTSFPDPIGGTIGGVTLPGGMLTVVPEPVHIALGIFGGLAALFGGLRRWRHR